MQLAATPFQPIPNSVPADTAQTFHGLQCVNGTYNAGPFFETPATAQTNVNANEAMFATFVVNNVQNTQLYPGKYTGFQCNSNGAAPGWEFSNLSFGSRLILTNDTTATQISFDLQPGINRLGWSNDGTLLRVSINGGAIQTLSNAGSISAAGTLRVYWNVGAFTSMVKLARLPSDVELQSLTSLFNLDYKPGSNPWAPSVALMADLSRQWSLDLTTYTSGTIASIAGPAGTGFNWTKNGAPTVVSWTINWHMSPASLFQSCAPVVYDQKHASKTTSCAEIIFTGVASQAEFMNIALGFISEDTDNNDEGAGAIFVNGRLALIYGPGTPDGLLQYEYPGARTAGAGGWWYTAYAPAGPYQGPELYVVPPPYTVRIVVQDQVRRIDTFNQGASIAAIAIPSTITVDTAATAKRLLVISDGTSLGGHNFDIEAFSPTSGAPINRLRGVYAGKVTGFLPAIHSISAILDWGNGSVVPFARYAYERALQGAPAIREYLLVMGLEDWSRELMTVAAFSASYQLFVNTLRALDPSARIAIAPPIQTTSYAVVNGLGETLQQFVNASNAITGGTIVNITGPSAVPLGGTNNYCPTEAGQYAVTNNIVAALP